MVIRNNKTSLEELAEEQSLENILDSQVVTEKRKAVDLDEFSN